MGAGRVAERVALVSGAGTGIGRAVAVRLAEEGAIVVATSRTLAHVEETARLAVGVGGRAVQAAAVDVQDAAAIERVVADVVARHGRIDVVSVNAGVELPPSPAVWETTDADWARLFDVNVTGAFRLCRAALPHMPEGGSIVLMGSINSFVTYPGNAAYTATKGALLQFTKACALDAVERGVRVNCVCPGVIDTPLTHSFLALADDPAALRAEYAALAPMNRLGTPREVANCVLFLASDEASFITGSALVVDGGTLVR